jgi:hypothetical protein
MELPMHAIAALLLIPAAAQAGESAHVLPATFEANRVFLHPTLSDGRTLSFYLDSGGGDDLLCRATADSLHLPLTPIHDPEAEQELGKNLARTPMPAFRSDARIPPRLIGENRLLVHECPSHSDSPVETEGFLSSRWLAGRVWTWNYPASTFRIEDTGFHAPAAAHAVKLGFKTDDSGKRLFQMIRIPIRVDGKDIDMLLDTGAMTQLTPSAKASVGDGLSEQRATSFIVASIFDEWRVAHPEWRVVERSDVRFEVPMIEVADVEIAGEHAGSVWFSYREDSNFHDFMSAMTDRRVEGAIGGDAFRHFVMTIDYPNAVAYFRCAKDCKAK